MVKKIFGKKKIFMVKKICGKGNFLVKKFLVKNNFCQKKIEFFFKNLNFDFKIFKFKINFFKNFKLLKGQVFYSLQK